MHLTGAFYGISKDIIDIVSGISFISGYRLRMPYAGVFLSSFGSIDGVRLKDRMIPSVYAPSAEDAGRQEAPGALRISGGRKTLCR